MNVLVDRARILWMLYRPVRGLLGAYICAVVVGTALESLVLAAIVPLLGGDAGGVGRFFDRLLEAAGLEATEQGLIVLLSVLVVLRAVTKYVSTLLAGLMIRREAVRLQVELFRLYLGVDWEVAMSMTQGELQLMLTGQTRRVADFLGQLVVLLESTIFIAGLTLAAVVVSPQDTLLAVGLIGVTAVVVMFLGSRIQGFAERALVQAKAQSNALMQFARGAHVLRAFGTADRAVELVEEQAEEREAYAFRSQRAEALAIALPDLLFVLALLAVVSVAFRSGEGVAAVSAIIALLYRISQYLKRFGNLSALSERIPDLRDVHRKMKLLRERAARPVGSLLDDTLEPGSVVLEDVSLTYEGAPRRAVDHVTTSIAPGEFVGVVGSSGGGKSTLVHLVVGLLQSSDGRIRIGGRGSDDGSVGFVPQMPFVLEGSIESNIRWFRHIDEEMVLEAARLAGLGPVLERLPDGIHSVVAQEGLSLSGGERQRLALARALAGSPRVLVLDEATSALDSESEAVIQRSLEELRGSVTVIAVAHRLSTVVKADRIWVMENGRLIENAAPSELRADKASRFSALAALQGLGGHH